MNINEDQIFFYTDKNCLIVVSSTHTPDSQGVILLLLLLID
jgi:hypothetical protein